MEAPKQKTKKQKKGKNYSIKKSSLIIWGVLLLFLAITINAIYQANQSQQQLKEVEEKVSMLTNEIGQVKDTQKIDTPETDSFLRRFLNIYFSIPSTNDALKKREEDLKEFNSALDFKQSRLSKVEQQIVSMRNYGYENKEVYYLAKYVVQVATKEKEPKNFTSTIYIPFTKSNKGYQIVSLPYQVAYEPNEVLAKGGKEPEKTTEDKLEDKAARKNIDTFIEQFLTEYQANNKENLKYLMKDVEGLPPNRVIELLEKGYFGTKEKPIVEVSLSIENKNTSISFKQHMRLYLTLNKDNKYFIERLEHY